MPRLVLTVLGSAVSCLSTYSTALTLQAWTDGYLLRLLLTAILPVLFADGNLTAQVLHRRTAFDHPQRRFEEDGADVAQVSKATEGLGLSVGIATVRCAVLSLSASLRAERMRQCAQRSSGRQRRESVSLVQSL